MSNYTLLLDMDGVCVDWKSRVYEIYGLEVPNPHSSKREIEDAINEEYDLGLPPRDAWRKIQEHGEREFWLSIEKYDWFEELISIANKFESWAFCTRPGRSHESSGAKHEWINNLLGPTQNDMYLCRGPKSQLANSKTILLDDTEKNIDEFTSAGGIGILFPQPWNSSEYTVPQILKMLNNLANGWD